MGKHVKVSAKAADPATEPKGRPGKYVELSTDTLERLRVGLVASFDRVRVMVENGQATSSLMVAQNGAAKTICAIEGELRAREKARRHTARNIPREVVVAYVRELSDDERARFVMECSAMAEGSVMG